MCNEFKSKKDFSFSFLSLSIGFFRFALSFSNRNLTENYTELELKSSSTYSLACDWELYSWRSRMDERW